mmetsp:Transcript_21937/g.19483  ORF Transcript_21937/g.19483 Transcript_21937/m.19483 type:complete len:286 (+) Transcript_21937:2-859(+)
MEKVELNTTQNTTNFIENAVSEANQANLKNLAIVGDILENSHNSTTNSQIQNPSEKSENNDAALMSSQNGKDINKRKRRLMQNRQSASRLRLKKKDTMSQLIGSRGNLKEENTTLLKNVEESQIELFNAMEESIALRKRIDQMQCKTNELLISYFNDIQNGSIPTNGGALQPQNSHNYGKFGEAQQTPNQQPNQYLLESRNYDLQTALSLLMATNPVGQATLPALNNLNLRSQGLNFENTANLRPNVQETIRHQTQTPNSLGNILNVLTQDSFRDGQNSAYHVPN